MKELASAENVGKLQKLGELAKAYGMELSQLVLAYTLSLPGMGPLIPAASSIQQLESNAKVGQMQLSAEQQEAVRSILS